MEKPNFKVLFLFSISLMAGHSHSLKNKSEGLKWLVPCETKEDCSIFKNATCQDGIVCNCGNDNSYLTCREEMENILVNLVGERCLIPENCNFNGSECDSTGRCSCKEGLVPSENKRKCLEVSSGIGDICEESIQCTAKTPSTVCRENRCSCRDHMHENNGSCYEDVGLAGNCSRTEECTVPNTLCINSKCTCRKGYAPSGQGPSRCILQTRSIDSDCQSDIECATDLGNGAYCSFKKCKCKDLYNFKAAIHKCASDHLLGDSCGTNADCYQPGTDPERLECILGVCVCRPPLSEEHGYCIISQNNSAGRVISLSSSLLGLVVFYVLYCLNNFFIT